MATATIARTASQPTDRTSQLERAVDRATAIGLEPVGQGRTRDGSRFCIVPSQTERGKLYVVRLDGKRLSCNCLARVVCTHVASVVMELAASAARRAEWAADVEEALTAEALPIDEPTVSVPAPRQRSRTGLMDDSRPISIFKQ